MRIRSHCTGQRGTRLIAAIVLLGLSTACGTAPRHAPRGWLEKAATASKRDDRAHLRRSAPHLAGEREARAGDALAWQVVRTGAAGRREIAVETVVRDLVQDESGQDVVKTYSMAVPDHEATFDSKLRHVDVFVKARMGHCHQSTIQVPVDLLRVGPFDIGSPEAYLESEGLPDTAGARQELLLQALRSFIAMSEVLSGVPSLGTLLQETADRPPLLGLLTGANIEIGVSDAPEPVTAPSVSGSLPVRAYRVGFEVFVNERVCLLLSVLALPPHRPLTLASGILEVTAIRPSDDSERVTIRLVEARAAEEKPGTGARRAAEITPPETL